MCTAFRISVEQQNGIAKVTGNLESACIPKG